MSYPIPTVTISPYDNVHSLGAQIGTVPASAIFPVANRAIFVPFRLFTPATAYKMFMMNGTTVSGNADLGIYTLDGVLLRSTGSFAQAGVSQLQVANLSASLVLQPGRFLMAIAMNNATGHIMRRSINNDFCQVMGVAQMASAFPLPATVTLAAPTAANVPFIGVKFFNA